MFLDKGFQVNKALLAHCPGARTMHYLPALRGKEMDDYAMDFEGSLLWQQAENRLHTQRGLLAYLMGPRTNQPSGAELAEEESIVREKIDYMNKKFGTQLTHATV